MSKLMSMHLKKEGISSLKNENIRLRAQCKGVVPLRNQGQVSSQATTSKIKGKEVMSQKVKYGRFIHAYRSKPESD